MSPDEIRDARRRLGRLWGLDRPLFLSELAQALRMAPASANKTILEWERGKKDPSGPVTVALSMMLAGAKPPDLEAVLANPGTDSVDPVN